MTLWARVRTPGPVLDWVDPYDRDRIPQLFDPLELDDDSGAIYYRVPKPYAERLLSGDPHKFKLADPEKIVLSMTTSTGGTERVPVVAMAVKRDSDGKAVKDWLGVTEYVESGAETTKTKKEAK